MRPRGRTSPKPSSLALLSKKGIRRLLIKSQLAEFTGISGVRFVVCTESASATHGQQYLLVRNWSNQGRPSAGLLAQPSSVPIYDSPLELNQQATRTPPGMAEQIDLPNRVDGQERSPGACRRVFLSVSRLYRDKVYKIRLLHRSWSSAGSPGIRRYQNTAATVYSGQPAGASRSLSAV